MGVYPVSSKQKRNQCGWCGMEVVKVGEMKSEKRLFKGPINHCKILHFTLSKMKINEALWTKDLTCPDKLNSFFWLLHWEQIGVEQTQKIDTRQEASAKIHVQFSSFQSLRHVWLFATPWTTAHQASLSITNSQSPAKPMSIELVMPSNQLILCCLLLLLSSIYPSIRVFSNERALHIRWPKDWSFSFNISPSNEHPGLISFRMDWLDLLAVQGTLKSLLQHDSSIASILWHSVFFIAQLSHPYMTTGNHSLD